MRLLLDEHLSWRRVAPALRDEGHDVLAAQEAPDWSDVGREHAGLLIIWTIGSHEHDAIVRGVMRALAQRPTDDDWRNLVIAL